MLGQLAAVLGASTHSRVTKPARSSRTSCSNVTKLERFGELLRLR